MRDHSLIGRNPRCEFDTLGLFHKKIRQREKASWIQRQQKGELVNKLLSYNNYIGHVQF